MVFDSQGGAASNRTGRIRAYAQVRQWLALDLSLDPALRADLLQRLEDLGVNPLEDNLYDEARFAQRQCAALLQYADDPNGLGRRIDRDRSAEIVTYEHGLAARLAFVFLTPRASSCIRIMQKTLRSTKRASPNNTARRVARR